MGKGIGYVGGLASDTVDMVTMLLQFHILLGWWGILEGGGIPKELSRFLHCWLGLL